mgnify:CR=1 FL=1
MSELKEYKLNELYVMSSGISSSKNQAGSGYPFVSFRDIFNNTFLPENLTELMNTSDTDRIKYSVKKGDVFITRTSETPDELAMSSVALKDYPNATFSGFAKRLRPIDNKKVYDKYMAFYFRSKYFRKIVNANTIMTLRASFNEEIFSYIKIQIPDYDTQVKIGDMLYKIEKKILINNQINNNLEELMKTIYQRWFIEFEFPNEEGKLYKSNGGKLVYNDILKRDIPECWKVKNIMEFIRWEGTSQPPKSCFAYEPKEGYIRFIQNRDYEDEEHRTYIPKDKALGTCNKYDILIDKYGDAGKTRFGLEGAYNVALAKINVKDVFYREYIRNVLSSKPVYEYLHNSSMASTRSSLNENNISYINLVVPDNKIIEDFNIYAKNYIEINLKIIEENQRLKSLKEFILPFLMNGQINVDDIEI